MKVSELDFDQLLELLEKDGRRPMVCDTPIPFYDNIVKCGSPTGVGDIVREVKMVPHTTLSMLHEFFVIAGGDSMEGVSIEDGDILRVKAQPTASDGDVVLAMFDGDSTVKTYCEDEKGQPWLVPQNPKYKAFPMSDADDACIVGVVTEIIKQRPRVKFRDCQTLIQEAKEARDMGEEITEEQVSRAIKAIAPMVEVGRQWYAVCRVLVDVKVVTEGDFEGFCQRVKAEVPEHPHLPARDEMVRMAVQSFKKPVAMWNELNAPVQGKRFKDYLKIAERMQELLEEK
jgi:hypothetical protein